MASKTQRKPAKRSATKPARVAVAPGKKKLTSRGAARTARPAKKAAAKKASAKKAPAKKAAPRKAVPKKTAKKAPPKKAAPKKAAPKKAAAKTPVKKAAPLKKVAAKAPAKKAVKHVPPAKKAAPPAVKKAAPEKKVAPVKKAAPAAAVKKAAAPPEAPKKVTKEAAPGAAAPKRAPRTAPATPPAPAPAPETAAPAPEAPAAAPASVITPAPAHLPGLGGVPKKRGRKRRDPLDDLLKPEKPKRGRPRKRTSLTELIPKRARLRKRIRGRRSSGDEMDLPVAPRPPAPRDSMTLDEIRTDVLARYLHGETPACPVGCGGLAQVVRISTAETGAGEVWLECLSCAQRERFEVPAPSAAERDAIFATLEAGNEPLCKRHDGRYVQLRRRGRDLVCPECGILIQGR